jgi:hypothetical protein
MMNREPITSLRTQETPISVLSDRELLLVGERMGKRVLHARLLPPEAEELDGLLWHLWQEGMTSVWVMPSTRLSRRVTCAELEQVSSHWTTLVRPAPSEPSRPSSALIWPRGSERGPARRLALAFPAHADWNWALPDATSLLATVTYLDQLLARQVIDAPELLCRQLLTDLTLDQPTAQLRSSPLDPASLLSSEGHPIPLLSQGGALTWMRPLTLEEQRQRYLHKYTAFSGQLQACLDVQLGAGIPQFSSSGRACDGVRPGLWRVSLERAGSLFDGKLLPGCLDQEWMSTPQISCCRDIGYRVQVREGYFWPESHQLLKRWAATLWQAAERLHTQPQRYRHAQARANASQSIKRVAELGVDLLARPQKDGGWGRPDWWAQIAGRRLALLFARLVGLVRQGSMPVLVDGDALWVVSNDPNPLSAVPGLLSVGRWNGYLPGYEVPVPLTRDVRDAFRAALPVGQVVTMLDSLAREDFP